MAGTLSLAPYLHPSPHQLSSNSADAPPPAARPTFRSRQCTALFGPAGGEEVVAANAGSGVDAQRGRAQHSTMTTSDRELGVDLTQAHSDLDVLKGLFEEALEVLEGDIEYLIEECDDVRKGHLGLLVVRYSRVLARIAATKERLGELRHLVPALAGKVDAVIATTVKVERGALRLLKMAGKMADTAPDHAPDKTLRELSGVVNFNRASKERLDGIEIFKRQLAALNRQLMPVTELELDDFEWNYAEEREALLASRWTVASWKETVRPDHQERVAEADEWIGKRLLAIDEVEARLRTVRPHTTEALIAERQKVAVEKAKGMADA